MSTSTSKSTHAKALAASQNGQRRGRKGAGPNQQDVFTAAVDAIARRFGVKVASAPAPAKNPYAMSAEQAEKIALQAGIITPAGNLTRRFK